MQQLICSTSYYSVGCTFLDWSINYLSGQTDYYNRDLGRIPLSAYPLTQKDSHGHRKNHPKGLRCTMEQAQHLRTHSDFVSMYPAPLLPYMAIQELGLPPESASQDWALISNHIQQDYNQTMAWLHDQGFKVIFVHVDPSLSLYLQHRSVNICPFGAGVAGSFEAIRNDIDRVFFSDSIEKWEKLGLTDIWDQRERLALDFRPLKETRNNFDLPARHRWIDCRELWGDADCIPDTVKWTGLEIDHQRLASWIPIFQEWREIQHRALRFQYQYQHIVEATIKGWDYPIDLTFDQEVIILHCLLYQHDLNVKSWNLTKFPSNTRELHRLLEPNIHQLNRSV